MQSPAKGIDDASLVGVARLSNAYQHRRWITSDRATGIDRDHIRLIAVAHFDDGHAHHELPARLAQHGWCDRR
jgi:hypothetical protein